MTALAMYVPEEQIRSCTPGLSQEVTERNLGFGNLYYALVKMLEPKHVLVIGSGFGFSVAVMATALAQIGRGRLTFVDPSMDMVRDGPTVAHGGSGQWDTPEQVIAHFSCAGIPEGIITHYRETNEQFFPQYSSRGLPPIDLALIDGAHDGYNASFDLKNVIAHLRIPGYVLMHDVTHFANRIGYMGVTDLVHSVRKQAGVEEVTFPGTAGLALLRITASPTIEIQKLPSRSILLPVLGGATVCGLLGWWLRGYVNRRRTAGQH